jgi:hypothetical protein
VSEVNQEIAMYQYRVVVLVRFQYAPSFRSVWVGMADTAEQAGSFAVAASSWGGTVVSCQVLK